MNGHRSRLTAVCANGLLLLSCLPSWLAFRFAVRFPRSTQRRVRRRLIRRNTGTEFDRRVGLRRLLDESNTTSTTLFDYADYRDDIAAVTAGRPNVLTSEPVLLLQPTGGTTGGTKLIPFTRSLGREFRAALNPWLFSLLTRHPGVLAGRHYWAISPTTPFTAPAGSVVPVGFVDDAEYFGALRGWLLRQLLAVPPEVRLISDHPVWQYVTLLFLLRDRSLSLLSIWHPSFLTTLMAALPTLGPRLARDIRAGRVGTDLALPEDLRRAFDRRMAPDPTRADEVLACASRPDAGKALWPRLAIISCWTDGWSAQSVGALAAIFPGVAIQGKGLLGTEGVVTLPSGPAGTRVCAVRSHYLEFADAENGAIRRLWELAEGRRYSVALSTAGGLYRYRTHDLVEVTGFMHGTPCLRFVSRDNAVCDLVGEKLALEHAERVLADVASRSGLTARFLMLAPAPTGRGYVLLVEADMTGETAERLREGVEQGLSANFHYAHALRLGQLAPLRLVRVGPDAAGACRARLRSEGRRDGDIKLLALRNETFWESVLAYSPTSTALPSQR
jgi:hypothetical protein